MFEDSSKINLVNWNDFNCKGVCYFKLKRSDIETLSSKKLLKITNGRTFESFTKKIDIEDNDYFIQVAQALKNKNIKQVASE